MNKLINILLFTVIMLSVSCKYFEREDIDRTPIARVFDKYLYKDDIEKVIYATLLSEQDSITAVETYIQEWMKRQLLITKSELNLSDELKDVERELEDYKASLLIYRYEQEYIKQNLDTTVTEKELRSFYLKHATEFPLHEHAVKGMLIKISKKDPNIRNVKKWFKSDSESELTQLKDYCFLHAQMVDTEDEWIFFNDFVSQLPDSIEDSEKFLKNKKYIEQEDDDNKYFLRINDYKLENDTIPLYFINNKIKALILNKRKTKLIHNLEKDIYNDALDTKHVEVYENN